MEIHQKKMKAVALIEHYKVDQLTMVISSPVGPKKAKYFRTHGLF
jgi:predicted Fe-Mo cluster-binding NifX family protein